MNHSGDLIYSLAPPTTDATTDRIQQAQSGKEEGMETSQNGFTGIELTTVETIEKLEQMTLQKNLWLVTSGFSCYSIL